MTFFFFIVSQSTDVESTFRFFFVSQPHLMKWKNDEEKPAESRKRRRSKEWNQHINYSKTQPAVSLFCSDATTTEWEKNWKRIWLRKSSESQAATVKWQKKKFLVDSERNVSISVDWMKNDFPHIDRGNFRILWNYLSHHRWTLNSGRCFICQCERLLNRFSRLENCRKMYRLNWPFGIRIHSHSVGNSLQTIYLKMLAPFNVATKWAADSKMICIISRVHASFVHIQRTQPTKNVALH